MTPRKRRRLYLAIAILLVAGGGTWLIISALKDNLVYSHGPSEVAQLHIQPGVTFVMGGLVAQHSLSHGGGAEVHFTVTDKKADIPVVFHGVLPALFREGQGVVATGAMNAGGTFEATEVLAKHDEKYMPPEVVRALKQSGEWQRGGGS